MIYLNRGQAQYNAHAKLTGVDLNSFLMTRLTKSALLFVLALLVFGIFRGLLLWVYSGQFDGLTPRMVASAFMYGVRFDASTVVVVFIVPLLLMNIPFAFAQRAGWFNYFAWLLYALTLIMAGVLVGDLIYFGFVDRHLGYEIMLLGNDGGFVLDMAFGSYKWIMAAFAVGAALLFAAWYKILTFKSAPERHMAAKYAVMLLGLIVIGRGGITNKPISAIDAFTTGETRYGNLVLNGVFTAAHASNNSKSVNHHFMPLADALHGVQGSASPPDAEFPMLKRYPARPTGRNIVFVMLESWDPKYIDSFGGDHFELTPNFDALAGQGLRFDNFYAAGQRSIEGAQAALTGLPILTGMPVIGSGLELSNISRLGSIAKSNGYSTLMVQSAERVSFRMSSIASATGFDQFYGMEDIPMLRDYPDPRGARFGWDYETLMFFKNKLDTLSGPFVSMVFTGTTHIEYARLGPQFELRPHSRDGEGGFLNTLYYADWSLGEFLKSARQSPWFGNTVFIFCADHTQGHYQKTGTFIEKFRIPFLIYAPAIYKPQVLATVGSQLDIMPTIIDILGFGQPFAALGESLFRKRDEYAFVTEGGDIIGLITPRTYLKHSLKNRLETGTLRPPPATAAELDAIERTLLALDQISYELVQSNKWAR